MFSGWLPLIQLCCRYLIWWESWLGWYGVPSKADTTSLSQCQSSMLCVWRHCERCCLRYNPNFPHFQCSEHSSASWQLSYSGTVVNNSCFICSVWYALHLHVSAFQWLSPVAGVDSFKLHAGNQPDAGGFNPNSLWPRHCQQSPLLPAFSCIEAICHPRFYDWGTCHPRKASACWGNYLSFFFLSLAFHCISSTAKLWGGKG